MPCPAKLLHYTPRTILEASESKAAKENEELVTCPGCQLDLRLNKKGEVIGEHPNTCILEVTF